MFHSFNDFNDIHKSFLQEIGNMGAGNAATEIANMTSASTDISTPTVRVDPAAEAQNLSSVSPDKAAIFRITLCGDMKGAIMFVFPFPSIERLVGTFFPGVSVKTKDDLDEMTTSTVRETVNIAAASYANSMALMSGITVDISVPEPVSQAWEGIGCDADNAICSVKNTIEFTDNHSLFEVLFYPELGSITGFMEKIGIA